jgi:signal transduction histidine kinase
MPAATGATSANENWFSKRFGSVLNGNLVKATQTRSGRRAIHIAMDRIRQRGFHFFFCVTCLTAFTSQSIKAELLTNAVQVLSLTDEQAAQRIPVRVTGVVTVAQPDWAGRFFLQDDSGGVFVELISNLHPETGDAVEVVGVSFPGGYAPIITAPKWKKIGTAPLPEARPVPIEQIMSGAEDGQRVEVAGVVRAVVPAGDTWDVGVAAGGYRIHVFPKPLIGIEPADLIGARVRVRGTVAASFNAPLRHLITVAMFVPLAEEFIIEKREAVSPFEQPTMPLNSIAQYRRDRLPGKRVHVRGTVTLQRRGEDFFIEDESGGLQVRSRQAEPLTVGEAVEAVGFPEFDGFLPVLTDAVFKKSEAAGTPVATKAVTVKEVQDGLHHAGLISLTARLLGRSVQHEPTLGRRAWLQTRLLLEQDNQLFTALVELPNDDLTLAGIPINSTIEVSGVCFTELGDDKHLKSLQVLMPNVGSVRLLAKPSWWTSRRLLIGSGILFAVLVGAVIWTVIVEKRNAVLGRLIREKEQAQLALQQANEHLEDRVRERTAQLKFQITARKEAEVQFKGTLLERTRLAQELHDTLEQSLTGIALQLDTSAKLFQNKPDAANHHLELARDQVTQSQVEVRRSIWDLRSRALERFDLPAALTASSRQLMEGTPVQIKVTTEGRVRPLPEIVEDNLLRIGQEAMTNIIKHSQATAAEIHLDYGPKNIVLRISDNGRGFVRNQCDGPAEGHFGLQGIAERVKRLKAELTLESEPGKGTLVMVRVGLETEVQSLDSSEL